MRRIKLFYCFFLFPFLGIVQHSGAIPVDSQRVMTLIHRALDLQEAYPDSSFSLAQQALALSKKIQYDRGIAYACMRLGSILNARGQNDSASFYIKESFRIRKKLQDYKGAANCGLQLGYIYNDTGKKDSAFYILYESIRLNRLTDDSSEIYKIYLFLGKLSMDDNDSTDAYEYFNKSVQLTEELDDDIGQQKAYNGIGLFYLKWNQYDKALSYFLKESKLLKQLNNPSNLALNQANLGACYTELNQFALAKRNYRLALQGYTQLNMLPEKAILLYNISGLFRKENQLDSALSYMNQSLEIAYAIEDPQRVANNLWSMAEIYANKQDYYNAYNYYLQYASVNDSINSVDKEKNIDELKSKYKTEIQQKQIALQNAEIGYKLKQRNISILASILLLVFLWLAIRQRNKFQKEKRRSDKLLLNILPNEVAEELKETGSAEAKLFQDVTVLFTDFVNFTTVSEHLNAIELVSEIHKCFTAFDDIIEKHGLEKIKTIGDAYLAVSGIPVQDAEHANKAVQAALDIQSWIRTQQSKFDIRIGLNSGSVVAGIVGVKKFAYDIWGDTVNTAARMEQNSEPGKVNISGTTYALVKDHFSCRYRGKILAKNKGEIDMYFVEGPLS